MGNVYCFNVLIQMYLGDHIPDFSKSKTPSISCDQISAEGAILNRQAFDLFEVVRDNRRSTAKLPFDQLGTGNMFCQLTPVGYGRWFTLYMASFHFDAFVTLRPPHKNHLVSK